LGPNQEPKLSRFSLIKLNVTTAFGAACFSSKDTSIPRNYKEIVQVFYSHGLSNDQVGSKVENHSMKNGNSVILNGNNGKITA
jgi:hypothetical protein